MSVSLSLFNFFNQIPPNRGFFGLRARWLRVCGLSIGRAVKINTGVKIYDRYIEISDHVWVGPETLLASCKEGRIFLGACIDIAPRVSIVTGSHKLGPAERRAGLGIGKDVVIGAGTWIGAQALILGGAIVGKGTVIAAGAVVLPGQYPDNVLLAGVPAKVKQPLP